MTDPLDNIGYFDPFLPISDLKGNLPHWRQEGVTYFVTFRLADSIPLEKIQRWIAERDEWLRHHSQPLPEKEKQEYHRLFIQRIHRWLDAGYGACELAKPNIRQIVADAFIHFVGTRYLLREWVIMPNHTHVIVTPINSQELSGILHSWKSFSGKEINKLLGRAGQFWQKESFDHIIRSPEQLEHIEEYIHHNPRSMPANSFTLQCIHQK